MTEEVRLGPSRQETEDNISRRLRVSRWAGRTIFAAALTAGASLGATGFLLSEAEPSVAENANIAQMLISGSLAFAALPAKHIEVERSKRACQDHVRRYATGRISDASGSASSGQYRQQITQTADSTTRNWDWQAEDFGESISGPLLASFGSMMLANGYIAREYDMTTAGGMALWGGLIFGVLAYTAHRDGPAINYRLAAYQRQLDDIDAHLSE